MEDTGGLKQWALGRHKDGRNADYGEFHQLYGSWRDVVRATTEAVVVTTTVLGRTRAVICSRELAVGRGRQIAPQHLEARKQQHSEGSKAYDLEPATHCLE